MEKMWEVITIVLPAILSGIITFLITKYTYNRDIPLDKMETSYNRVYYPIYKMLKNEQNKVLIMDKVKIYLEKYDKYVDISTIKAFKYFRDNVDDKKAYMNFESNIYNRHSFLRRRLGYLEPSIFSLYRYSSKKDKRVIRCGLYTLFAYLSIYTNLINIEIIKKVSVVVFALCIMAFIVELVMVGFDNMIKLVKWIKNHFD